MKPKYFILRSKKEADEFLDYAIESGDAFAKNMSMPEHLSEKRVKCEMKLGKREQKRFVVSYPDENSGEPKFYSAHPTWIQYTQYYEND